MVKDKKISSPRFRYLTLFFKLVVLSVAFWYIYRQVFLKENIHDILASYKTAIHGDKLVLLIPALLLMFMNWGLESQKWRLMIRKIERISFGRSVKAVLTGITVSFFTPNRVGEFGGRILHLHQSNRIKGALITVLCSMSQLAITIVVGSLALILYLQALFSGQPFLFDTILLGLVLLILFTMVSFLYPSVILYFLNKFSFFSRFSRYTDVFNQYKAYEQLQVFMLSLLRYLVFSVQYLLILKVFNVEVPVLKAFQAISLTFLVITLVPTIALTEIGIRGSAALFFIGFYSVNTFGILTASFTLWLINLVIPSLAGSLFVLQVKLNR